MRRIFILLLIINITCLVKAQDTKYSRIQIYIEPTEMGTLAKQGIPPDAGYYDFKENCYTAELSAYDIQKLKLLGYNTTILVDDVSEWYVNRNASADKNEIMARARLDLSDYPVPQDFELGSCGGFYTLDELYAELDWMASLYPDLITVKTPVGSTTTFEGRSMYYVKISDNPNVNEAEPQVLYTGMHHAREPIGMQHLVYYMYYLLENYDNNQEIRDLVNNTEMYFIPVINIDGYARNIATDPQGGGMWRKNRFDNGDGSYGIDVNRNYGLAWGIDDEGSSPYTWDDTYRGTGPFSEAETQMVRDFCVNHNFKVALNYHSYSNLLLYAWGYQPELSPDENVFAEYAKHMIADNHFTYGPGCTTIYPTNGGSDDWMYGEQETKDKILAYTPEVGGDSDGFWPAESNIIPLCQENMIQSILAARYSGTYGELADQTPLIIPEKDYYVSFELTRLGQTPGTYTVSVIPLGDSFESVGDSIVISNMEILQKVTDSIPFKLRSSVKSSDSLRYVIVLNDGYITYRDTVERYFGTPIELFSDDLSTTADWTGQWDLSSIFPHSAPSCMADSPIGNYGNFANKSTMFSQPVTLTNASVAVLNFYARWKIEPGFDYVQLFISNNDGLTWTPLEGRYTKKGTINQAYGQPLYDDFSSWVKEEINISQYADQNIKLKFTLRSDNNLTYDGYYFDDLTINIIDRTVDVKDIDKTNLSLYLSEGYPNPAGEIVTFKYNLAKNSNSANLYITDLSGRTLKKIDVDRNSNQLQISLNDLKPGIYLCTLKADNSNSVTRKVTVK